MGADVLSMATIPDSELEEAFNFFDHDKKTFLSDKEFAIMVRSLGQTPSNMELDALVREFAGNQQINLDTAKLMMQKIYSCPQSATRTSSRTPSECSTRSRQ